MKKKRAIKFRKKKIINFIKRNWQIILGNFLVRIFIGKNKKKRASFCNEDDLSFSLMLFEIEMIFFTDFLLSFTPFYSIFQSPFLTIYLGRRK